MRKRMDGEPMCQSPTGLSFPGLGRGRTFSLFGFGWAGFAGLKWLD